MLIHVMYAYMSPGKNGSKTEKVIIYNQPPHMKRESDWIT